MRPMLPQKMQHKVPGKLVNLMAVTLLRGNTRLKRSELEAPHRAMWSIFNAERFERHSHAEHGSDWIYIDDIIGKVLDLNPFLIRSLFKIYDVRKPEVNRRLNPFLIRSLFKIKLLVQYSHVNKVLIPS